MATPLWRDYYVNLGKTDGINYRLSLKDTGEIIYSGRAYLRPGSTANEIRINDVCADYISNTLPELTQAQFSQLTFPLTFNVHAYVDGNWALRDTVAFLNDWSYDNAFNVVTEGIAFPVLTNIDRRQWLTYSVYNAKSVTALVVYRDGSRQELTIEAVIASSFNISFNSSFARSLRGSATGTAVIDVAALGDVASITIGGVTFNVIDTCSRYALYYVNEHGGWDSLLIEGGYKWTDNLTRYTREVDYDNRNVQNRGAINYVNEVKRSLSLSTGWLNDEQSARMRHLLNSTSVYMLDMERGEMLPLLLTDNTYERKTFRSNDCKLVNYSINCELAQTQIRR